MQRIDCKPSYPREDNEMITTGGKHVRVFIYGSCVHVRNWRYLIQRDGVRYTQILHDFFENSDLKILGLNSNINVFRTQMSS